ALAGIGQLVKIIAADFAHTQGFGRNSRLLGKNTGGQLVSRHFEAEQGDRRADSLFNAVALVAQVAVRAVEGDVGGKRAFAHARTAGKDDKVGIVESSDFVVDRFQTRGFARNMAARIERGLDQLQRL